MPGAVRLVLILVIALAVSSCSPAQKAPADARGTPPRDGPVGAPPSSPASYIGVEGCKECHESSFGGFAETKMGRLFLKHPRNTAEHLGCESCHGPGKAHADARGEIVGGFITFSKKDRTPVEKRNQMCLTCHTKGSRVFWQGSAHESSDVACTACHRIMKNVSPRSQLAKATEIETCGTCHLRERAQQMRSSHMPLREGKMTCTSCHSTHGTVTPALLKGNSLNETCYTCHAEKRGPFLWEHAPVTESCANCHNPHGSNHEKMLKLAQPRLCQQCHSESRLHATIPSGPDRNNPSKAPFVLGRSCVNCHSNIHGSNHPSGAVFTR